MGSFPDMQEKLRRLAEKEMAPNRWFFHLFNLTHQLDQETERMILRCIDPVIVIEEPAWKLPGYGEKIVVLRNIVHWDDTGVTLLK